MSLNNIVLTDGQIAHLYPGVLIEPKTTATIPKKSPSYLGNNERKILLLVNYPVDLFLPDKELSFLTSVLSACKLSLADVAIVNINLQSEKQIEEQIQCLQA